MYCAVLGPTLSPAAGVDNEHNPAPVCQPGPPLHRHRCLPLTSWTRVPPGKCPKCRPTICPSTASVHPVVSTTSCMHASDETRHSPQPLSSSSSPRQQVHEASASSKLLPCSTLPHLTLPSAALVRPCPIARELLGGDASAERMGGGTRTCDHMSPSLSSDESEKSMAMSTALTRESPLALEAHAPVRLCRSSRVSCCATRMDAATSPAIAVAWSAASVLRLFSLAAPLRQARASDCDIAGERGRGGTLGLSACVVDTCGAGTYGVVDPAAPTWPGDGSLVASGHPSETSALG